MKVEQLSIFLENKAGRLAEVTHTIASAKINIRALSLADTSDFGILRLIVDDTEKAKLILKDAGFTVGRTAVVAVEVAPDLKTCKAYISVLGDKKAQEDTIKGLQSAEGYIRRELARTVNMRNTPQITFIVDQSIEYGVNISKKIDEVTRDLKDGAEE